MKLFAAVLFIAVLGLISGNELPQSSLDEIKAQSERVEDKISSNRSITVDDVLGKSKTATEKVLAQPICDLRSEKLLIYCFFLFVYHD